MELKFVIPNMEKTFGNLEFAGEDKVVQRRINGRLTVLSRSYGGLLEVNVAMKYIIYNKFPYIGFLSKKVVYLQ